MSVWHFEQAWEPTYPSLDPPVWDDANVLCLSGAGRRSHRGGALDPRAGVPPLAIRDRRLAEMNSPADPCRYSCSDSRRVHMCRRYFLCVEDRTTNVGSRMMVRARGLCLDSSKLRTSSAARWPIIWLCWSMLDRGTRRQSSLGRFPQPIRAMSSGILRPASRIAHGSDRKRIVEAEHAVGLRISFKRRRMASMP